MESRKLLGVGITSPGHVTQTGVVIMAALPLSSMVDDAPARLAGRDVVNRPRRVVVVALCMAITAETPLAVIGMAAAVGAKGSIVREAHLVDVAEAPAPPKMTNCHHPAPSILNTTIL